MTRRLMVMTYDGITGRDDRDPTPSDISAWLHAHPKEAVEIVKALKVAGPWVQFEYGLALPPVRRDAASYFETIAEHTSGEGIDVRYLPPLYKDPTLSPNPDGTYGPLHVGTSVPGRRLP